MNVEKSKKAQGGFSLLELLLVVAVGAVLILAGLGAYRLVSTNNDTNTASRQLATLKQQIQSNYSGQATYGAAGPIDAALFNMRAYPQDMNAVGTVANSRRGVFGDVLVASAANRTFTITFNAVPRSACARLGTLNSPDNAQDFNSVTINGTLLNAVGAGAAPAINPASVATACNIDANVMVWSFD